MCGITGALIKSAEILNDEDCKKFVQSLTHRGPDGQGIYRSRDKKLMLGHTRLAIIDKKNGAQPFVDREKKIIVTFNGEIYNYVELRKTLVRLGHSFTTNSDTEVIVEAYKEWGISCQDRFNGMWAFALYDNEAKKLFISRDRFGVKPLFVMTSKYGIFFASELKAFMRLPQGIRPRYNKKVISKAKEIEPRMETILENVWNIRAGHYLIHEWRKENARIKKWYTGLEKLEYEQKISYSESKEELRDLINSSCSLRMRSDVPLAITLSGGLDSSVIAGQLAARSNEIGNEEMTAFTINYQNSIHSEKYYAELVTKSLNLKHKIYEIDVKSIPFEEIEKSIFSLESIQEPHIGPYYLYQKMKESGYTVSLEGHAGDELFGGYHHQLKWAMMENILQDNYERAKDLDKVKREVFESEVPEGYENLEDGYGKKNMIWEMCNSQDYPYSLVMENKNFLNRLLYRDFCMTTLPVILRNFDRLSMASGVEVRSPLLDYRIVQKALSMPSEFKIGDGKMKRILRDACKKNLPRQIYLRASKLGFASPMKSFLEAKNTQERIKDICLSQDFKESVYFDGKEKSRIIIECIDRGRTPELQKMWRTIQSHILIKSMDKFCHTDI